MKLEPLCLRFAKLFSVLTMMVFGLLPIFGDFSVGRADENEVTVEQSPLYVFRFIEVAPGNVANWKQAVKEKQLKFNTGKEAALIPFNPFRELQLHGTCRRRTTGWSTSHRYRKARGTRKSGDPSRDCSPTGSPDRTNRDSRSIVAGE